MSTAGLSKALNGALPDRCQSFAKIGATGLGTGSGMQKFQDLTGVRPVAWVVEGFEKLLEPLIQAFAIRVGLHRPDKGFYLFRPHDAVLLLEL